MDERSILVGTGIIVGIALRVILNLALSYVRKRHEETARTQAERDAWNTRREEANLDAYGQHPRQPTPQFRTRIYGSHTSGYPVDSLDPSNDHTRGNG